MNILSPKAHLEEKASFQNSFLGLNTFNNQKVFSFGKTKNCTVF
jgi:hypothetical protein